MSTEIVVALITSGGLLLVAIVGALVQLVKFRKENSEQHGATYSLIQSIDQRTMVIDSKVDRHGEWMAAHDQLHASYGDRNTGAGS